MSETPPRGPASPDLSPVKRALQAVEAMRARLAQVERAAREPIAVIGIGCRFPGGAASPADFWDLLAEGRDGITEVPPDRWDAAVLTDPDAAQPGRIVSRFGGFVPDPDLFDARFFGISPREAASLDPQQRLLLEVAWEALEHAGLAPDRLAGSSAGVFVGQCTSDYFHLLTRRPDTAIDAYLASGNAACMAAGRIAYTLGLTGPAVVVDTACSSSLVAVHQAVQALRAGECALALAGGVSRLLAPHLSVSFSRARMLAPDGRCKTFDAAADGYVRGEGCGLVVLKRQSDAEADGDRILAVIRGSAVNQDGRTSGLTVPHGPAQEAVIAEACTRAGIDPRQLSYVEAHGTGTALGDPIELGALAAVAGRDRAAPLVVGSVKTNIGHLEGAAGIAGLIKTVLALSHRAIPRHINFTTLTPHAQGLPLTVPRETMPWPAVDGRRLAGVSGFGFSGTNAHIVVEEAPDPAIAASPAPRPLAVLKLAAATSSAFNRQARRYADALDRAPAGGLAAFAHTADAGRADLAYRWAGVFASSAEAVAALRSLASPAAVSTEPPTVTFWWTETPFPCPGPALVAAEPVVRRTLDEAAAVMNDELLSPAGTPLDGAPALAWGVALARLWQSWGVEPGAVGGDGIGRLAAVVVAEMLDLTQALPLAAALAESAAAFSSRLSGTRFTPAARRLLGEPLTRDSARWLRPLDGGVFAGTGLVLNVTPSRTRLPVPSLAGLEDGLPYAAVAALYRAGVVLDWAAMDRGRGVQPIDVPTTPFERRRCWFSAATPGEHPLLGRRIATALPHAVFEVALSARDPEWLGDHCVRGTIPLPGTASLEAALAGGLAVASGPVAVVDLILPAPLALPDAAPVTVQSVIGPEEADGGRSFALSSRTGDVWTTHARARVVTLGDDARSATESLDDVRRRCAEPVPEGEVSAWWRDAGIDFGPAFRGAERFWRGGDGEALGLIRRPAILGEEAGRYRFHPAFLDAALQTVRATLPTGGGYVMAGLDRFVLHRAPGDVLWSLACRAGTGPIFTVRLFDADGVLIGEIEGLRLAAVAARAPLPDLYRLDWRPAPFGSELPGAAGVAAAVAAGVPAGHGGGRTRAMLEQLALDYAGTVVASLLPSGTARDADALARACGLVPRHRRLFARLLAALTAAGRLLLASDGTYRAGSGLSGDAVSRRAALMAEGDPPRAELTLLDRCGPALGGVLNGTVDPLSLLFPDGDSGDVLAIYRDSAGSRLMNTLMGRVAATIAAAPGERLRVLEIGGGTGATTATVLPLLPSGRTAYTFTDVSPLFTTRASETFAAFPFLTTSTLDIERDPVAQGFTAGGYDVVMVANVLHATVDLERSLDHARRLLAPGGLLVLLETVEPRLWVDLIFGLTDGWWRFADTDLRPDHALLDAPRWTEVLRRSGFSDAHVVAPDAAGLDLTVAQAVVLATAVPVERHWRVLSRDDAAAEAMAAALGPSFRAGDLSTFPSCMTEGSSSPDGVVVLADGRGASPADRLAAAESDCAALLGLVQRLVGSAVRPRLAVVTAGSQSAGNATPVPEQAALWGLGKVVAAEHAELDCALIDVEPGDAGRTALRRELAAGLPDPLVAWRNGERLTPELAPLIPAAASTPVLARERAYLVTGGLGGMGLRVAGWLARRGARHIALLGRSAPNAAARSAIADLEHQGVTVAVLSADVADRPDLAEALGRISRPLGGIVHAAGVFDDRLLINHDAERFRRVFAPKLAGTWNLVDLTRDQPLDFVVLFSSVAAVFGPVGLGNYVAANAYLDAIAHRLQQDGRAVVSVDWGPWAATGMADAVGGRREAQWSALGIRTIDPDAALAGLEHLLAAGVAQGAVLAMDWPVFLARQGAVGGSRYRRVAPEPAAAVVAARDADPVLPAGLSRAERRQRVAAHITVVTRRILGFAADEPVDTAAGFFQLGMDSLTAVELRNRLQSDFGVALPTTLVFRFPTIDALSDHLAGAEEPVAAPSTADSRSVLDDLEELESLLIGGRGA